MKNLMSLLICVVVLLTGCSYGMINQTGPKLKPLPFDKNVEVLYNEPEVDYIELGIISTESSSHGWCITKLQVLAKSIGAKAIILQPHNQEYKSWYRKSHKKNGSDEIVGWKIKKYTKPYYKLSAKAIIF